MKSSNFLSNENPPEKSGCGPTVRIFSASSNAATDIRNSDQLRKFPSPATNYSCPLRVYLSARAVISSREEYYSLTFSKYV